jgi:hypothetical protein
VGKVLRTTKRECVHAIELGTHLVRSSSANIERLVNTLIDILGISCRKR